MNTTLILITLLFTKHFIVDFPLQNKFQWSNKGTYGHPGGLLHSALHGNATMLVFWWYAPLACVWLGFIDAFIHYHIDWAKMKLGGNLTTSHKKYWIYFGLDQLLHSLTYAFIIGLLFV